MTISKEYIKNTLLIGISFVLMKSFNLALPYFLDAENYNSFNKIYYTASLLSTLGTFGFTYAITQINLSPILLAILVFCNICIGYLAINFFSGVDVSFFNMFNILLISFSSIIFSIYNFQLLFTSKTNKYFLTIIILSLAYYSSLLFSLLLHFNLLILYGTAGLIAVMFCFKYFESGNIKELKKIGAFYKIGFSTFIINSSAGVILMADKFFANNFFGIEVANAYTFAWAIVAPIFYLGNVAEKNIYAADNRNSVKSSLLNSFGLITIGLISYALIIYLVTKFYPNLFPNSINIALFADILLYMLIGYSLFIFSHFPINGILFKLNYYDSQKLTSYAYLAIIALFAGLYFFNVVKIGTDNYLLLLILVVTALLILSISKFSLLFYLHKKAVLGLFKKT